MTRDIALLTNPVAGQGRGQKRAAEALEHLRAAGFGVRDLRGATADETSELGRAALADGAEALVVCGGDGMVHLGAQLVAGTGIPLGIIPAGTGNDVARYLDLPRADGRAAAEIVTCWRPRSIDLARSGDRWFVTVLATGFDARVNERANAMTWPTGQLRYNLATAAELRTLEPLPYILELDGRTLRVDALLVAVGNGPSYGGGMRIAEGALLDDGLLDVVIVKSMSRLDLIRTFPKLFKGTHIRHPRYEHHTARTVTVAAPGMVAYADGERFGALPLTVQVVPGALRVLSLP
ncbi:MAG: diacylglycerol kinase [Nocardioidaceae bacterium]